MLLELKFYLNFFLLVEVCHAIISGTGILSSTDRKGIYKWNQHRTEVVPENKQRPQLDRIKHGTVCPSEFTGLYPYEHDCRKFLNCWKGRGYVQNCAPGTVFNANSRECDIPSKVNCYSFSENSENICSRSYDLYVPHENDCSRYFKCLNGIAHENSCSEGTLFNPLRRICDDPQNFNCENRRNTEMKLSFVKEFTHESAPLNCESGYNGLKMHPTDCSKFINCANGIAYIQSCARGTLFNSKVNICDFAHKVNCDLSDAGYLLNSHTTGEYEEPAHQARINSSKAVHSYANNNPTIDRAEHDIEHDHAYYVRAGRPCPYHNSNLHDIEQDYTVQDVNQPSLEKPLNLHTGFSDRVVPPNHSPNQHRQRRPKENITRATQFMQTADAVPHIGLRDIEIEENIASSALNPAVATVKEYTPANSATRSLDREKFISFPFSHGAHLRDEELTSTFHQPIKNTGTDRNFYAQPRFEAHGLDRPFSHVHEAHPVIKANREGQINYSNVYSRVSHSKQNFHGDPEQETTNSPVVVYNRDIDQYYQTTTSQYDMKPKYSMGKNDLDRDSYDKKKSSAQRPFNPEYYKPTQEIQPANSSGQELAELPISEAIKALLRPYLNRSGTVSNEMLKNTQEYIMEIPKLMNQTFSNNSFQMGNSRGRIESVDPTFNRKTELEVNHKVITPEFTVDVFKNLHSPTEFPLNSVGHPTRSECELNCGNGKCIKALEICDGVNNCGNRRDEEVCDHLGFQVRLSNEGNEKHHGRVEVKVLGKWGYVCDDKFGLRDADVLCKELGFSLGASEIRGNSYYPPNTELINSRNEPYFLMDEVECNGNESSIRECDFKGWGVHDCSAEEVVGVICKIPVMKCPNDFWLCKKSQECIPPAFVCDSINDCSDNSDENEENCVSNIEYRLSHGTSNNDGRLEVKFRGIWGTVCDDNFGETEAVIACRSLGLTGPVEIIELTNNTGDGPIWLDEISCTGTETKLEDCSHWAWGEHNCNHTEDVVIKCTGLSELRPRNQIKLTASLQSPVEPFPMEKSARNVVSVEQCGVVSAYLPEENFSQIYMARVISGNKAKRGYHPWQATIRAKSRNGKSTHWCGAVLISNQHLLTAAHCLVGFTKGGYFIRLGDHYSGIAESSEVDVFIENWFVHENFRKGHHMNNDIAVIVLKFAVQFNDYIRPACLPTEEDFAPAGEICTISGWGSMESGVSAPSNDLRAAQVPILDQTTCKQPYVYGQTITDGMFCAGYLDEGEDACDGDSGGPLVCTKEGAQTVFGLISWGQHCGFANKPGVYTNVTYYHKWINEKMHVINKI